MPDDAYEPFETGSDSFAYFALIQGWDLSLLRINDRDCWILMHPHDSNELRYQLRWIYAYITNGLYDAAGW